MPNIQISEADINDANLNLAVVKYLRANGMFDAFLAQVIKGDPTVGDVHSPASLRKPVIAYTQDGVDEEDTKGGPDDEGAEEPKPAKKADIESFEMALSVSKMAPEQQMVFGWASVSSVNGVDMIDKQNDIIPIEEIEKAAYDFVLYSREQGDMHADRNVGKMIESLVFTPEKAALGVMAKTETGEPMMGWWVGFKVTSPAVWDAHKRGDRPEFSIGGKATPVPQ